MVKRLGQDVNHLSGLFERTRKGSANQRTSFRLPANARQEMFESMAKGGYGLREKSRWILDTVEHFLDQSCWDKQGLPDLWKRLIVDNECVRLQSYVTETVLLPQGVRIRVWRASIDAALYGAQLEEPVYLEISIAAVLRAAVLFRLGLLEPM